MTKPTEQQLKTLRAIADGLEGRFNEVKEVSKKVFKELREVTKSNYEKNC